MGAQGASMPILAWAAVSCKAGNCLGVRQLSLGEALSLPLKSPADLTRAGQCCLSRLPTYVRVSWASRPRPETLLEAFWNRTHLRHFALWNRYPTSEAGSELVPTKLVGLVKAYSSGRTGISPSSTGSSPTGCLDF